MSLGLQGFRAWRATSLDAKHPPYGLLGPWADRGTLAASGVALDSRQQSLACPGGGTRTIRHLHSTKGRAYPLRGEQIITQRFTVGYPVGQRECSSRKDGYQRGSAHVRDSPRGGPQEGGAAAPRDKPLGYFQAFLRDAISREGPGRRLTTGVAINRRYYENPSPRHSCALTQMPHLA